MRLLFVVVMFVIHRPLCRIATPSAGFAGAILLGGGRSERAARRATTVGRGAEPPSESRQPALSAAIVLHVTIALPLPDA